jgi:hypothetical protein
MPLLAFPNSGSGWRNANHDLAAIAWREFSVSRLTDAGDGAAKPEF